VGLQLRRDGRIDLPGHLALDLVTEPNQEAQIRPRGFIEWALVAIQADLELPVLVGFVMGFRITPSFQ